MRNPNTGFMPIQILYLEDSQKDVELVREVLADAGINLELDFVSKEATFLDSLRKKKYDLILADYNLPGFFAPAALSYAKQICPGTPFICISGGIGEDTAVELLKNGATDYVSKERLKRLPLVVERALHEIALKTERKKAIEDTKLSEARLADAQSFAHLGSWEWDLTTDKIAWSDELCRLFEISGESIDKGIDNVRMQIESRIHPDDLTMYKAAVALSLSQKTPYSVDYRIQLPGGLIRYINAQGDFKQDDSGCSVKMVGTAMDITGRKQAEYALKNSLSLLEATLESIHNGILVVSSKGTVIKTNATFADMWHIPENVLASGDDSILLNHVMSQLSYPEEFIAKVNELYEKPESETFDFINFKDGRIFERISKPMMFEGKPEGRVWSFLDVTARTHAADALHEERWRLESIVEATRAGTWEWNVQTGEAVFNQVWAQMVGYTLDELAPSSIKTWQTLTHPDDLEKSNLLLNHHYAGELPYYDCECRMKHKNGHWIWIHDRGRVITRTNDGKPLMMFGTHTDISDRKQAEEQLLISQLNFNQLVSQLNDIIWQANGDGTGITDINHSFEKVYGISSAEFSIRPQLWIDMVHPDDRKIAEESGRELFENGNSVADYRIIRPDGEIKWINDRKSILYDQNGKAIQMGGVATDITVRKLLEVQLQIKNFAIDASPTALGLADFNGTIFYVNDAFIKLWGYDNKTEVMGKPISEFSSSAESSERHIALIKLGQTISVETECIRKDGTEFTSLLSAGIITSAEGNPLCMMALFVDITELKRKEAEINSMNEQLIQANSEKDKFFSIIAHDLRSPFNAFLGFTQMLVEELDTMTLKEIQKIAVSMRNSATNLFRLLENLLEWSRIRRGITPYEPEPVLLASAITEAIRSVADSATKKGIEVMCNIPADLEVFVDKYMLASTVRNLASNALKFTKSGGKITITTNPAINGSVEVSVKDTGIGMNNDILSNLFRLDVQTNRKGTDGEPSSGLGLIICKEFVEKHGGKLRVESQEGYGSVFYFTLPVTSKV